MSQNLDFDEEDFSDEWNQGICSVNQDLTSDLIQDLSKDLIQSKAPSFQGVRHSNIQKDLPAIVAVERNIIKVPICVLHPKTARAKEFVFNFQVREENGEKYIPRLVIASGKGTPLPLSQHAKVLDILLAMLAHQFNEQGEVWFSFSDIARELRTNRGDVSSIKESIRRYYFNTIHFQRCWVDNPDRFTSRHFLIIKETDLFDDPNNPKNPRNSRKREDLHYVKFAPEVVQSVKKNFIRLFPKEAFSNLDAGTYTLYKLFYAPTDREPIIRSVSYIANFLGWGNRTDRLHLWIVKHLEILQKKEFILWWRKKEDCFEVCSNAARFKRHIAELRRLNPLKADKTKALALKESRKKAKLLGEQVDAETLKAVSKGKKGTKEVTASELLHTERIFGELSKMTPSERSRYLSSIKEVPELNKKDFISSSVAEFLENQ